MADVTLTYKGNTIAELNASGNKTLKTAGKYCEADILLAYVKSGGGSGYNILKGSSPPSAAIGQDGDVYLQYDAIDGEIVNTYVKVNGAWQSLVGSDVDAVVPSGVENIAYNGEFDYNTTGVTSWSAANSGTSEQRAVKIIDGWFLMQCDAEKVSGGLKIIPKQSYGYLLNQINRWFAGNIVTITAVVNGITYKQTGTISSGASVVVATPWGNIYFYNYSNVSYYLTFQFANQINTEFIIKNVSVIVA